MKPSYASSMNESHVEVKANKKIQQGLSVLFLDGLGCVRYWIFAFAFKAELR